MVTIYRRPSCSGHCTLPRQAAARIAIQLTYRWRERDANGCVRGTCQSDAQESACPRQGDHQDVAYRHGLQQIAGLRGHVARVHIGCRTTEQGGTSRVRAPLAAEAERAQREELDGPDGHAVSWSASRASRPHGGAARAGAEETRRTNHRGDDPLERRRRPADPERGSFQSPHARSRDRASGSRPPGWRGPTRADTRASGLQGHRAGIIPSCCFHHHRRRCSRCSRCSRRRRWSCCASRLASILTRCCRLLRRPPSEPARRPRRQRRAR
jgi:hypothetical protein